MIYSLHRMERISIFLICLMVIALFSTSIFAQDVKKDQESAADLSPLEYPDDEYVYVPLEGRQTSPGYVLSTSDFFTVQVNTNATGQNIVGDAANEPSIAVDPTNPNSMVIGWRQFDTITNNFRQAGNAYTTDGGLTWTNQPVIEPGVFRSDPVLDVDSDGTFYYNSLSSIGFTFFCHVFKSTDGGATWDAGTFAFGGDKQWMAIDRTGGIGDGHNYSFWTDSWSYCFPGMFTRSTDLGATYENCVSVTSSPYWGTLNVGPDGALYVGGASGSNFAVVKSTNAQDAGQTVSWDFSTTVSLGGLPVAFAGNNSPNPDGLHGQAWVATDHSGGANHGNVYLLCSVDPTGNPDPCDVMFSRSTDGGSTWSAPVRINDDSANDAWQWLSTMSVAPNGRIDVVWLDTRLDPGGVNSALYYSFSDDGGLNWSANEQLSDTFDPHVGWPNQNKMGDYFDMVSDNDGVHLAWANTLNGEQDVYYANITQTVGGGGVPCDSITSFQARCQPGGTIQMRVNLQNSTQYAGETVIFDVDGTDYPATIQTNGTHSRAAVQLTGQSAGAHTVTLEQPAGCFTPIVVNCPVSDVQETGLAEVEGDAIPLTMQLAQNFPNPFNPSTTINFGLSKDTWVSIKIYDLLGRQVATLVDGIRTAGSHSVQWDGTNNAGKSVSGGVYIYQMQTDEFVESHKMLFAK